MFRARRIHSYNNSTDEMPTVAELKEKAKLIYAESGWLRWFTFGLALVSTILAVTIVCLELTNIAAGAYYRAGMYAVHGVMALIAFGAWADKEPMDVKLTIVLSIAAFIVDIYLAIFETTRVVQCSQGAPITTVDNQICTVETSSFFINLIFAWVFTILALLQIVIAIVWIGRINDALAAKHECGVMEQKVNLPKGTPFNARYMFAKEKHLTALRSQMVSEFHMGTPWLVTVQKALGVIGLIVFLAVVIIEMIFMYDAAFYRTVFLIIAAHATGSSLSVFGAVPKYWPWIIALFSALGFAASLAAAIIEIGRQARCGAPATVYEQQICTTSGWRAYIGPIESSVVSLLMLLTLIFAIWSIVSGRTLRVKKAKSDVTTSNQ